MGPGFRVQGLLEHHKSGDDKGMFGPGGGIYLFIPAQPLFWEIGDSQN